jgi:hypothetical protein
MAFIASPLVLSKCLQPTYPELPPQPLVDDYRDRNRHHSYRAPGAIRRCRQPPLFCRLHHTTTVHSCPAPQVLFNPDSPGTTSAETDTVCSPRPQGVSALSAMDSDDEMMMKEEVCSSGSSSSSLVATQCGSSAWWFECWESEEQGPT